MNLLDKIYEKNGDSNEKFLLLTHRARIYSDLLDFKKEKELLLEISEWLKSHHETIGEQFCSEAYLETQLDLAECHAKLHEFEASEACYNKCFDTYRSQACRSICEFRNLLCGPGLV